MLTTGHASCVEFVQKFDVPVLVLGGGGYTMRNVARAWAYETGLLVGQRVGPGTSIHNNINQDLPYNDYYDYFSPTYTLTVPSNNMENLNSREYLHKIMSIVLENIKRTGTGHAPSVPMQQVPRDREDDGSEEEERQEMEERRRNQKIGKLWHNGSISTDMENIPTNMDID
jgi:histone deacetylase 1/2